MTLMQADWIGSSTGVVVQLTPRELEILRLLCDGWCYKRIAQQLSMSDKQCAYVRYRIGVKTGCKTGTQLGAWAAHRGLHATRE